MRRSRSAGWTGLLVACVVFLGGCSANPSEKQGGAGTPTRGPSASSSEARPSETSSGTGHQSRAVVVVISVDGLNPDAITELGPLRAPAFARLAIGGASTYNARASYEATVTLPNHTSMLTGRTITGANGSGVMFNNDNGSTLEVVHGSYVPGVFDVAHDHGLATAFYAEKSKFRLLLRSWNTEHGAPDLVAPDDGPGKVDESAIGPAASLIQRVEDDLAEQRAQMVFLHVAAPDAVGHAQGFMSDAYLDAVVTADKEIGAVLDLVESREDLRRSVTVIVTADHGGVPPGHRFAGVLGNYRIPFFAWGRGVRPGSDLYALNTDARREPGTARPSYDGPQPIRNRDAASLALGLLGLPPLEGGTSPLRVR